MKGLVGAAVLVVIFLLGTIAFDLHQLAVATGRMTGSGVYAVHLTKEEQVNRLIKSTDDGLDMMEAIVNAPRKARGTSSAPPHRP